jgi:integrase
MLATITRSELRSRGIVAPPMRWGSLDEIDAPDSHCAGWTWSSTVAPAERGGTPLNTDNVRYRVLAPAIERSGLSGIGFHAFRHTCASMLIERAGSHPFDSSDGWDITRPPIPLTRTGT